MLETDSFLRTRKLSLEMLAMENSVDVCLGQRADESGLTLEGVGLSAKKSSPKSQAHDAQRTATIQGKLEFN